MLKDGKGIKCRINIADNFSCLSRAHERYRQTTDRQTDRRRHNTERWRWALNYYFNPIPIDDNIKVELTTRICISETRTLILEASSILRLQMPQKPTDSALWRYGRPRLYLKVQVQVHTNYAEHCQPQAVKRLVKFASMVLTRSCGSSSQIV